MCLKIGIIVHIFTRKKQKGKIMNALEKIIAFMQIEWQKPTLYGWKHLMFLGLMAIAIVIIFKKCKKLTDKQFRIIMASFGGVLILLEIFKQLNFAFDSETGVWEYAWKQFPFQFCSVPMYVMLLVGILKESKFRDYLCSFLATFGLFAGLIVMIYPSTVLSTIIFRFCQSMIHHIAMVLGGLIVVVSGRVKFEHKTILKGMSVFSVIVGMAFIMNIVFHMSGNTSSFNMFYIGPYSNSDIPVLKQIGIALNISADSIHIGNFAFLIIYIAGFSMAAYIILLIEIYIKKLFKKKYDNQLIG